MLETVGIVALVTLCCTVLFISIAIDTTILNYAIHIGNTLTRRKEDQRIEVQGVLDNLLIIVLKNIATLPVVLIGGAIGAFMVWGAVTMRLTHYGWPMKLFMATLLLVGVVSLLVCIHICAKVLQNTLPTDSYPVALTIQLSYGFLRLGLALLLFPVVYAFRSAVVNITKIGGGMFDAFESFVHFFSF
ncbi:MAG: hypothetical protein AAFS10_24945 [Myxococcota bacterium]